MINMSLDASKPHAIAEKLGWRKLEIEFKIIGRNIEFRSSTWYVTPNKEVYREDKLLNKNIPQDSLEKDLTHLIQGMAEVPNFLKITSTLSKDRRSTNLTLGHF